MMKSEPSEVFRGALERDAGQDIDQQETTEWLDALEGVARVAGIDRVRFLLQRLAERASYLGVSPAGDAYWLWCK
jgi:pyruvate dehydrogenase E1 component